MTNSLRYQAIEDAVELVKSKTAVELSEETHVFSRSWHESQNGEELDIYVDLLDDFEFQQMLDSGQRSRELVHAVFPPAG